MIQNLWGRFDRCQQYPSVPGNCLLQLGVGWDQGQQWLAPHVLSLCLGQPGTPKYSILQPPFTRAGPVFLIPDWISGSATTGRGGGGAAEVHQVLLSVEWTSARRGVTAVEWWYIYFLAPLWPLLDSDIYCISAQLDR